MSAEAMLAVQGVVKRFGGVVAVDGVSFAVGAGEILGLLGPNGSGKTTLINVISGALRSDGGAVRLAGADITGLPSHRIARARLARTFQLVRILPSMTAADNVVAGLAFTGRRLGGSAARDSAERLLARVGLAGTGQRLAGELTYIGQKRLELARVLAMNPRVLLLDEWLAGLNPAELREGIALIRSLGDERITIVMVEHVMEAIRALCGRCVVMNSGRLIAEGPTGDVLGHPEVVSAYLGSADA